MHHLLSGEPGANALESGKSMARRAAAALAFVAGVVLVILIAVRPAPPQPAPSASPETFRNASVFQVAGRDPVDVTVTLSLADATYANSFGYFVVDDPDGTVDGREPGTENYVEAAMRRAVLMFDAETLSGGPNPGPDGRLRTTARATIAGGTYIVLFLIQDSDLDELLSDNPTNDLGRRPLALMSLDAANPDGMSHLVGFGAGDDRLVRFAFEDLTGGGDADFNDAIFQVDPPLVVVNS